jgi:HAMP domain-containing protein
MYLTAEHAADLVWRDTRLAMSNLAVTVLNSVASQPLASPILHERFLQTMVNAKLEDEIFPIDIVFALLQDSHGAVTAWGADEPALVRAGWKLRGSRADKIASLRALSSDPALAARHGVVVVQASLEDREPSLSVTLGCRRQAAANVVSQIVARHVAVGVLIVLTALVSLWVALGYATRPIREVFRAVNQVSNGRLGVPILARQRDEVGEVAEAVDEIRLALARGRQWQELALNVLATSKLDLARLPREAVYLAFPLTGGTALEEPHVLQLLESIIAQEGTVEGVADSWLFASWGRRDAEQDDLLRAIVTGLELSQSALRLTGRPLWPRVCLRPEAIATNCESLGSTRTRATPNVAVWLDASIREGIASSVAAGELAHAGEIHRGWQVITWGTGPRAGLTQG